MVQQMPIARSAIRFSQIELLNVAKYDTAPVGQRPDDMASGKNETSRFMARGESGTDFHALETEFTAFVKNLSNAARGHRREEMIKKYRTG